MSNQKALDPGLQAILSQLEQVLGTYGLQLLLAWLASLTKTPAGTASLIQTLKEHQQ